MTTAQILAWLHRDGVRRVVLVEVDYMYQVGVSESAVPTRGTLYFSNFAYVDEAISPPRRYQAALIEAPEYERSLDRKTLRGKYNTSVGSLVINNADGEFDYILDLAIDGSEVRVLVGDETWAKSDFVTLYVALSIKASAAQKRQVTIDLRDPGLLLRKSIGGMVEVGGTGPSANQFRPLNFGFVHQLEPIVYDSALLIYAHSDTGVNTEVVAVRDNGVDLSGGWTDNGDGTFTLSASPAGQITCDVLATANADPVSYRLSNGFDVLIGDRAGMTAAGRYTGAAPAIIVGGFNDYHIGESIKEKTSVTDKILDDLTNTLNGFWAFTRLGSFYYSWIRGEALTAIIGGSGGAVTVMAEIAKDDIRKDAFALDHGIPSYSSYQAYGNVNWTNQSQFATSLTPDEVEQYKRVGYRTAAFFGDDVGSPASMAYRGDSVSWRGGAPELYHLSLSDSQLVSTLISGPDDGTAIDLAAVPPQSVDQYLQDWASVRRSQFLPWNEFLDVTVGLDFYALELGDIVNMTFPRHGMNAGKLFQLCKIRIKPMTARVDLGMVRRRFADVNVNPHGCFFLLTDDGGYLLQDDGGRIETIDGICDDTLTPPGPTPTPSPIGPLVVELLFSDGAPTGPTTNTGTIGGTFLLGDGGTGSYPTIHSSGGVSGGYVSFSSGTNQKAVVYRGPSSLLIIGTADFRIEASMYFSTYSTMFGQGFWGWGVAATVPFPSLILKPDSHLYFYDGVATIYDTGYVVTLDTTYRKYTVMRTSGVVDVLVDDVSVYSVAFTANCTGSMSDSFFVGTFYNGNGGLSGAAMDNFRFWNWNV